MRLTIHRLLTGAIVASGLWASGCSGPAAPAQDAQAAGNPAQAEQASVIELPPPKDAKPGEKYRAIISPVPLDPETLRSMEKQSKQK